MTVWIAHDVPPAVRGHLKRWFIEPRPNVFVGTLNTRTHQKILQFILDKAPSSFGLLVISSSNSCQGFSIQRFGANHKGGRGDVELSGLSFIAEQQIPLIDQPF